MILRVRYEVRGGHTHCRMFMGEHDWALGKCGDLTFRNTEFELMQRALEGTHTAGITVEFRREAAIERGR